MALTQAYSAAETPHGFGSPSCYIRLRDMRLLEDGSVSFLLDWWQSRVVCKSISPRFLPWRTEPMLMASFDHTADQSPKRQLYTYLKTLPQFAAAQDSAE